MPDKIPEWVATFVGQPEGTQAVMTLTIPIYAFSQREARKSLEEFLKAKLQFDDFTAAAVAQKATIKRA